MSLGPRRANPNFYKLSRADQYLCVVGAPLNYLQRDPALNTLNFSLISSKIGDKVITIHPHKQVEFLNTVLSQIQLVGTPAVYTVGSYPTEQAAYEFSIFFCRAFNNYCIENNRAQQILWVDMGKPDWDYLKDESQMPDLVVIHGLTDNAEVRRLELARDFIRRSSNSTVLVVANTVNIIDYSFLKLGVQTDAIWQLTRTTHRKVV